MGLVSAVVCLPLAPVRMVVSLARVIQQQVEREQHDPAAVRRQLEQASEARAAGEISADEEARIQSEAIGRVVRPVGSDERKR
jgi:gas vesicle protein GvpG